MKNVPLPQSTKEKPHMFGKIIWLGKMFKEYKLTRMSLIYFRSNHALHEIK